MQEPHWHLRLHLPPRHEAPAGLRGGLHRYRRASPPHPTIDRRVQSQRARGQADMDPGGGGQTWALEVEASLGDPGLPASPPACLIPPASDDDECRAQPSPCANGHCVNTVGSFHCDCDEGYQPSPSLTECQGECDKAPVWHPHLGARRGGDRVGATEGVPSQSRHMCSSHAPSFPSPLQSPPPER